MNDIRAQARSFGAQKSAEIENARQLAALHLACGIDLAAALQAGPELKLKFIRRIERSIERERLKGFRRHWSYDLNRHIALKQALDRLISSAEAIHSRFASAAKRTPKQNGARRRRR
ncbi:cytoplasmic protein [Borborobacter arsenicus]|uniref:cytoplasmic protein n=1 Tax=Borborobacter arsenicus TaxID=1851146 RepID=UPI001FE0ABCD|nr:cytoplasmic protein [Pseudaminobacter arsenicus]